MIMLTTFFGCDNTYLTSKEERKPIINIGKTRNKAKAAVVFCKSKKFNTDFCILIDMSVHSGLKRFIVWDFHKDTIINSFLVGHGCCENPWSSDSIQRRPAF